MSADNWQPIETAPRDGTRVLIGWFVGKDFDQRAAYYDAEFTVDNEATEACDWERIVYRGVWTDGRVLSFRYEEVHEYQPTHWQPLPEPPKA